MFNDRYAIHQETKTKYCNLNPRNIEYFVFYLTKYQQEVEITATGKNTIPSRKILFTKLPV